MSVYEKFLDSSKPTKKLISESNKSVIKKNGILSAECKENGTIYFYIKYKGEDRLIYAMYSSDLDDAKKTADLFLANDGERIWKAIKSDLNIKN